MTNKTILVVDDKADVRLSLMFLLKNHGFTCIEAQDLSHAKKILFEQSRHIDAVLLDMNYQFDTTSGDEGLAFLREYASKISAPVIVMTAWSSVNLAVAAMQLGASDFFAKPWDNAAVITMLKKHLALAEIQHAEQRKNATQRESTADKAQQGLLDVLWCSGVMQQLKRQLDRIAATDATLFLRGENGTGKSCIARYVHQRSGKMGPCVTVNVAAIPESLFESELFGHKKGAFTDAKQDRVGRFEVAENGTLFLDEIGSLALNQQAKLLHVLESQHFEKVGDSTSQRANCRIISASNADFEALMAQGHFRADLYFRLNTIELEVPPLRSRLDDIAPLARHFITAHSKEYQVATPALSSSAISAMQKYAWPGNVRELSHMMARAVLMNDSGKIEVSDLAFKTKQDSTAHPISLMTLEEAEKKLLNMALVQTNNSVEDAATLLGISRSAIYRRLEKFNLKNE